jgi:hypothetical protein
MSQQPSLGRVVIFVDGDGEKYSARVSRVDDADRGVCTLHVDNPGAVDGRVVVPVFVAPAVAHDEGGAPDSWHWPPRVG